jgi:hypothetical protein
MYTASFITAATEQLILLSMTTRPTENTPRGFQSVGISTIYKALLKRLDSNTELEVPTFSEVSRLLGLFASHGLVGKTAEGKYTLTTAGREFVNTIFTEPTESSYELEHADTKAIREYREDDKIISQMRGAK